MADHKRPGRKKGKQKDQDPESNELAVMKFNQKAIMLRDLVTKPIPAAKFHELRRSLDDVKTRTFCEVADRIKNLEEAAENASPDKKANANEASMQLALNSTAIIKSAPDALEEARKAKGLDVTREKIAKWLIGEISFDRGFRMLSAEIQRTHGIEVDDMSQLAKHFPNITYEEISLFSLLERIPKTYLRYGTKVKEDNKENNLVPLLCSASHDGLTFTIDMFDDPADDDPLHAPDAYASSGITGMREFHEFVRFKPEVKKAFESLIMLCISNKRVYEMLFDDNECIHVGQGNISRAAYRMVFGSDPMEKHNTVNSAIESLKFKEKQKFNQKMDELEGNLSQSKIFDVALERNLELAEIYKIIGLLDHMPNSFENPFIGYILPYSAGVQVLAQDGKLLESVSFHPFYAKELMNNLYKEQKDIKKDNKTVNAIFEMLVSCASSGPVHQSSDLDKLRDSLLDRFGIEVSVLPHADIQEAGDLAEIVSVISRLTVRQNRKVGYEEMLHIHGIVNKIPAHLLGNVKSIGKMGNDVLSIHSIMEGRLEAGTYNPLSKKITLFELPDEVYGIQDKLHRHLYSHVLAHEMGESVWASLPEEQKQKWSAISQWKGQLDEHGQDTHGVEAAYRPQHFLTFYSKVSGPNDDFSDHFAIYLMQGGEFKEKAQRCKPLGEKYAFLMGLFTNEGKPIEFLGQSEFTVEQVTGRLEQEIQRLKIEEAIELSDAAKEERKRKADKRVSSVKSSIEGMEDAEREADEANEGDEEFNGSMIGKWFKQGVDRDTVKKDKREKEKDTPEEPTGDADETPDTVGMEDDLLPPDDTDPNDDI